MSVRQRIAHTLAAGAFGQAVTVLSQLALTPLFFRCWGAALYGEWLILSSIPAYLTMADLGIGSAAGNEMAMRAAAGDRAGAQQTFLGAVRVSLAAGGLALLAGLAAAGAVILLGVPPLQRIAAQEAAWILMGLALIVAQGFLAGVIGAGYRCCDRNALGLSLSNFARLLELLATAALLGFGQSPLAVCASMIGVRLTMLAVQGAVLRRLAPWLFVPGARPDPAIVRRLMGPALGFLAFPLGNALTLQAPVMIIGAVFGNSAVAMFSALRTLARVPVQFTAMINTAVWPEMSRAFGAGDFALVRRLHRASWGATVWMTSALGVGLLLAGGWIVHRWLGSSAQFDFAVFAALLALTALGAAWGASAAVLAAINAHAGAGLAYVTASALGVALAGLLAGPLGWAGLMMPMLLADAAMLVWMLHQVLKVTQDSTRPFMVEAFNEPWRRARRVLRR